MTEREACLQLIDNAIKRNADTPIVLNVLKRLKNKVRLIGQDGGRSNAQKAKPCGNSTNPQSARMHCYEKTTE